MRPVELPWIWRLRDRDFTGGVLEGQHEPVGDSTSQHQFCVDRPSGILKMYSNSRFLGILAQKQGDNYIPKKNIFKKKKKRNKNIRLGLCTPNEVNGATKCTVIPKKRLHLFPSCKEACCISAKWPHEHALRMTTHTVINGYLLSK